VARRESRSKPAWTDVKSALSGFDRPGLLGVIQDLYAATAENRAFLHARLGLGPDAVRPYRETIHRWLWPDPFDRKADVSIAKAKAALSGYRKAVDDSAGLAELMVFYCECAAGYCRDVGYQDEGYFDSLLHVFEDALKVSRSLAGSIREPLIARLDRVRALGGDFGYGMDSALDSLFAKYVRR
jgi:hypothetical protein